MVNRSQILPGPGTELATQPASLPTVSDVPCEDKAAKVVPEQAVDWKPLERQLSKLFGPTFWASDLTWDLMGVALYFLYVAYPLRETVQALGRRYRNRRLKFLRAVDSLVAAHARKYASDPSVRYSVAQCQALFQAAKQHLKRSGPFPESQPALPPGAFPAHLSARNLLGFSHLLSFVQDIFQGRPVTLKPKEMREALNLIAAQPRGGQPLPWSKVILALDRKALAQGKPILGPAQMARRISVEYLTFSKRQYRRLQRYVVDVRNTKSYKAGIKY